MRQCNYCKIKVGGESNRCPFCQNMLIGDNSPDNWPHPVVMKKRSYWAKIALFALYTACIICFFLDFFFQKNKGLHWSLLVIMWIVFLLFWIVHCIRRTYSYSRIFSYSVLLFSIFLSITSYFLGYWSFVAANVIPYIIIATMTINFYLTLTRPIANTLVYLIANLGFGLIPYVVLLCLGKDISYPWVLCLMSTFIIFAGAYIFKGRPVITEILKRFHL